MKYEEAIKQLEEISLKLEDSKLNLDEAIELYTKSLELAKICFETIKQTEGKVEIIKKQLDEITIKPFKIDE